MLFYTGYLSKHALSVYVKQLIINSYHHVALHFLEFNSTPYHFSKIT